MRRAEDVTFGGSGLDRAAEIRGDAAALAAAAADPSARVLPVWRGKPLLVGPAQAPGWLAFDHAALAGAGPAVFLGREADGPRFAADISDWEPDEPAGTPGGLFDSSEQRHPALPDTHVFADLRHAMAALAPRAAELVATAKALLGWHATHGFCARCGAASAMDEGGWQRLCPACGARHFPRTDPVVIMLITHGNDVLMGRSPHWPEGMYSLLAGFVEPGETLEAAVRREVMEEAGVPVGEVGYLASQPWPFPASLMIGCRGTALGRDITPDPVEIEDAFWVAREAMVEALAGRHPTIRPARRGAIARFLIERWLADRLD